MMYRKKYLQKKIENPLPPLQEDERIYLNVPYTAREFAKHSRCGFDQERKLWFAGSLNVNLHALVMLYGVHEATSAKAMALLKEQTVSWPRSDVELATMPKEY